MQLKLAVCAAGDPRSPRTWSGTPSKICRALEDAGRLGETIDSEAYLPKPLRVGVKVLSKLYYSGSRYVRLGRLERALRARHVGKALGSTRAAHVLHMGTIDLPPAPQGNARHYLFTDSTWDLWYRHATDAAAISPRLVRDVDTLERASYAAVDGIFTTGAYVKQNLIDVYGLSPDKITVVGTGPGILQPYHGPKDYTTGGVLFVAKERFSDKGGDRLLAGFALAHQRNPALRLKIVGQDSYRTAFGDRPGVTALGHVSIEQLQALFNEASLFAMPAANEPWGLVFLEALSCRTPILGLNRLALPELTANGQFGFCLETGSPEEIADALGHAFADPARLAQMGAAGQAHRLENFTWERTARLIADQVSRLAAAAD